MEGVFVDGKPLGEIIALVPEHDFDVPEKFVQMHRHNEVHITACAASRMAGINDLTKIDEYKLYSTEPNQKWQENPSDPFACVKVYYNLIRSISSVTNGRVQTITIPMPFLGDDYKECHGEFQFCIKKTVVRNGKLVKLEDVKIGRHRSFDPRIGKWVSETKPIEPKKPKRDERDDEHSGIKAIDPKNKSHYYISLRFYHEKHKPENQPDWHFEPVYVSVAGEDFYRIDAVWQDEEIVITATLLDDDSPEIPNFLRR